MGHDLEVKKHDYGHSVNLPPKEDYHTRTAEIDLEGNLFLNKRFGENGGCRSLYLQQNLGYINYLTGQSTNDIVFSPAKRGFPHEAEPGTLEYQAFEMLINI